MYDDEGHECSMPCSPSIVGSPCEIASVGVYGLGSLPQLRSASTAMAKRASRSQEHDYYRNYMRRCPKCKRMPQCKDDEGGARHMGRTQSREWYFVECDVYGECNAISEGAPTVREAIDNWNRGKMRETSDREMVINHLNYFRSIGGELPSER